MARELVVKIVGDSTSLEKAFARSEKSAKKFEREMTGTVRVTHGLSRSLGATLGGVGVTAGIKSAINAASDFAEEVSKTDAVFGQSAQQVKAWSKTTTENFAISERQALETASSFGALFAPIGIIGDEAAKQSEKLTELGADLASFYNTDAQSALDAIRSGLVGESEPLRRYGVRLSEARVQQRALIDTGKKNVKQLTEQDKALARLEIIFQDTAKAQGDFERSQDRLPAKTKKVTAQADNLQVKLGKYLVPTLSGAIDGVNKLADGLARLEPGLQPKKKPFGIVGDWLGINPKQAKEMAEGPPWIQRALDATGQTRPWWQRALEATEVPAAAVAQAKRSAEQRNTFFDNMIGRKLARASLGPLSQELAVLDQVADLIRQRMKKTDDITRWLNLEDQLLEILAQKKEIREQLAADAFDALQLKVDQAGLTKSLSDDLAALNAQKALVEQQIQTLGDTVAREEQLVSIQGQINAVRQQRAEQAKEAAEKARQAAQAAQFRLLGFGPTGGDLIPSVATLRKHLDAARKAIEGSFLDTRKTRSMLAHIRTVLAGGLGAVGDEVRDKIAQMLDDIDDQLKQHGRDRTRFTHINTAKFLASLGLGLTPEQLRRLRVGMVQVGMGGTVPPSRTPAFAGVTVNGDVHVHGVQDVKGIEREVHKRAKGRPQTRRGAQ